MWSRRASEGMALLAAAAMYWFFEQDWIDSVFLRAVALVFAAAGVGQLVKAYLNHPDRIAKKEAKRALPPRRDG